MSLNDNILDTIKEMLGIDRSYTAFDLELVSFINSTFPTLAQLGLSSAKDFVMDKESKWNSLVDEIRYSAVQSYVFYKVRVLFDPPQTAALLSAYENMAKEAEWRLNVLVETETLNE